MRFSDIKSSFKIDTFELAKGCPEKCHHCGNFSESNCREDMMIRELTREQIDCALESLSHFFAPIVTTGIGSEVTRADNFNYLADRIFQLRQGQSRMVLVTHGIHSGDPKTIESFRESVELAVNGVLAGIFVTVDQQRNRCRSNLEHNINSYSETLKLLRPVLACKSDARVSVSVQGDDQYDTMDGIDSALNVFQESLRAATLTSREFSRLHVNLRGYCSKGRAKVFVPDDRSVVCTVIPDSDFERTIDRSYQWRGWVDFFEEDFVPQSIIVKTRKNDSTRSYDDLAEKDGWEEIEFDV